jgi:DNA-binding transcriptional regulator LsrR (DeoR family)
MKEENSINPFLSGEKNPNSKLTESQVQEIRDLYRTGSFTMVQLAEKFGMSRRSISAVINKERWKHLQS